jgi:hypothetical protein
MRHVCGDPGAPCVTRRTGSLLRPSIAPMRNQRHGSSPWSEDQAAALGRLDTVSYQRFSAVSSAGTDSSSALAKSNVTSVVMSAAE